MSHEGCDKSSIKTNLLLIYALICCYSDMALLRVRIKTQQGMLLRENNQHRASAMQNGVTVTPRRIPLIQQQFVNDSSVLNHTLSVYSCIAAENMLVPVLSYIITDVYSHPLTRLSLKVNKNGFCPVT